MKITTLSKAEFDRMSSLAINSQPLRKKVSLSSLRLKDRETLVVDDVEVELSKNAFKDLLWFLKIPSKFLERFEGKFGKEGSAQFLNTIRTAMTNDEEAVLFVNQEKRRIDAIRHMNHTGITNDGFLGLISETIDRYDLKVSNFSVGADGSISVNTLGNNYLQIPGMKKEVFNTGVSFNNSARGGTEVSPFIMRLVCLNGLMSRSFAENYTLKNLEPGSIERFNAHMMELGANSFKPLGFTDNMLKSTCTMASLDEMQSAASSLMSNSKIEWGELQRYIPVQETTDYFGRHGIDTSKFTKLQSKNATTGTDMWSLVNGMTNFASNGSKLYFDDEIQRDRIMMAAGNLFARTYDTENIVISPYTSKIKTEVETGDMW